MLAMSTDTVLCRDLLADSGLPVLRDPVDVIHTGYNNNDKNIKLWVLTKSQAYSMIVKRLREMRRMYSQIIVFISILRFGLCAGGYYSRIKDNLGNVASTYDRAVVCNNGYIFVGSSFMLGGDYYMDL